MENNLRTLLRAAEFCPEFLKHTSAWIGHIPFAAWLISESRPRVIVELGTHYGHSYLAMCQVVKQERIDARCYAVDTWVGDEHASFYGEEVYEQLCSYHQQHYRAFSSLLRMRFDEAIDYFGDRSIDLLHIDGLHTYEAVKHDFESWLPKLAPSAVVLFHDINVRERNFGVWKLWDEIKNIYANTFEFDHSYGLGVLQLPDSGIGSPLALYTGEITQRDEIKRYFSSLGRFVNERFLTQEREGQIGSLTQAVAEREGQLASLNQAVAERDGQLASLNQAVVERDGQIANLNQAMAERDGQIGSLNQAMAERDGRIASLNQAVVERDGQLASLNQAVVERDRQIGSLNQAVVERDGQIANLNQAMAERDGQIGSLNQAMAERDGRIASLNQAVVERDGQLASLNQAVAERDGQLEEAKTILQSERDKAIKLLTKSNDKVTALENTLSRIHGWYGFRIISWLNNIAVFKKVD